MSWRKGAEKCERRGGVWGIGSPSIVACLIPFIIHHWQVLMCGMSFEPVGEISPHSLVPAAFYTSCCISLQ